MREKWTKKEKTRVSDGHPIPQRLNLLGDSLYKPKLLLKSPSMRAISNYNNLSIQESNTYDNLSFIPEDGNADLNKYCEPYAASNASNYSLPLSESQSMNGSDFYDYTTMRSSSVQTPTSTGSELGSEKNEMGSTVKLVSTKMEMSCRTWFVHLETIVWTISLAAGLGNLYRLPQTALVRGGLPFLIAYIILTLLIGLPLLFLELGIGQLAEEGFIKSWRAVPFFKGVGYVKLLAGCLLSIYYPLYIGLSLFYVLWMAKEDLPFQECAVVKMKETGYSAESIDRQECLKHTFLESPLKDPSWYGIYAALLFCIWIIIIILSIRRTKSFTRSLTILLFPTLACFIALTVKGAIDEEQYENLQKLANNTQWDQLTSANVWYYAAIQVFFSTNVGFGSFVTSAGIMYQKVNPLWTALGYTFVNLLFGIGSIVLCYVLSGDVDVTFKEGHITELHLITLVYDFAVDKKNCGAKSWAMVAYFAFICTGFISMATITYTLLKVITVETRKKLKWWQMSIILSFFGFIFGCAALFKESFQVIHLLDHYIVGNLILISVIIEVFALITFYGTERIISDFEFMLGHMLCKLWLVLWWVMPLILTCLFAWGLATLPTDNDPEWLYGTGWAFVLVATIFIFAIGFYTVLKQDGYTFSDKFKASFKPSKDWGPNDPMMRHEWIQWNTKTQQGERDFTLKRRGTRDYTRSIKKNAKKMNVKPENHSAASTVSAIYNTNVNDQNQNNIQQTNGTSYKRENGVIPRLKTRGNVDDKPLRITALVDSFEPPTRDFISSQVITENGMSRVNINPLSRNFHSNELNDYPNDSYGTFRKGPYVIGDSVGHICHKKYSHEEATEL